jgi:hypothetical protein
MLTTSSSRVALSSAARARKRQEPMALIAGTKVGSLREPGPAGRPGYAAIPPSAGRAGSPFSVTGAGATLRVGEAVAPFPFCSCDREGSRLRFSRIPIAW